MFCATVWRREMEEMHEVGPGGEGATAEDAACDAMNKAVALEVIRPGDYYEVDASEDDSDEWTTVLSGILCSPA